MPNQVKTSKPGTPDSLTVGTSGSALLRFAVVTASARNLPAWICGIDEPRPSKNTSTSPASSAMIAGPLPL